MRARPKTTWQVQIRLVTMFTLRRPLACLTLALALVPALSAGKVLDNVRLYFTDLEIAVAPGNKLPAVVRLFCAEGYRVGGYQFVAPKRPIPSYPENWAPIVVAKTDYSAINDWALELFNSAEPTREPFPLTITFLCVDISRS
jgi:hypothetical protein